MAREVTAVLSSSIVEQRQATLQEFSDVINAASRNLDGILKEIGWSIEDIQSKEPLATCPINAQHRMVESSLQHHIERCKWARDGYTREEQEESASLEGNSFFYENKKAVHAFELDADSQKEIMSRFAGTSSKTFPRTMDRLDAEFSPDQRLAIYEKIREKIQSQADKLDLEELEFDYDPDKKDDEKEKPKTHAEVLAEMRDYRRRRQSYRAKNVHITKKSKTDVMRDIIDAHMKFLEETLNSAKDEEEERKPERTHSRSREGSSSSSRDSRDHHRRRRSRSRDRSGRRDERSRSSSRSRDSRSHHHRHHSKHSKHSKHKHKSRHRSPSHEEFE